MRYVKRMIPIYLLSLAVVLLLAQTSSQTVTVLAEVFSPAERSALPTVVLDPGHGGEDGGAVSPNGVLESGLNLSIALRTRDLLRFVGLPVVMTRETDISIYSPGAATISERKVSDLKNRVRLVGECENPLLVSIHQNMFSESKYSGAQLFYAGTAHSRELAEQMQALAARLDPGNHRQAKLCQNVYLLNQIQCPGVLIECGFLSNSREEQLLQTEDYQKKLAAVLASALTEAVVNGLGSSQQETPRTIA